MIKLKSIVLVSLFLVSSQIFAADIVFVKRDKGKTHTIMALDLSKRAVLWEVTPCLIGNFSEKTSVGILVGCDDSNVVLLEPETGKVVWRRDLAMQEPDERRRERRPYREIKINRYHAERPDGFFVSSSDEVYVLIGRKGEYLMRCDQQACTDAPKADREESKK
ncbi:MAG: hypothetical protein OEV31_03340 [Gammaproteobacteria bacterium]|nr:hypothetical protein [Gammaproteobacteria bacterium]